jgi:hypothetical protein
MKRLLAILHQQWLGIDQQAADLEAERLAHILHHARWDGRNCDRPKVVAAAAP